MQNVERMRLGVIVERRETDHPWQDHAWRPIGVLVGAPPVKPEDASWRLLAEGPGWAHFHAGTLELELFPKETEAYQINLTSAEPVVYVILRWREGGAMPEVELFHITVSADEVQEYLDAGNDIIEGVPMPAGVRAWVEGYVARYHQAQAFEKRPRKRWKDDRPALRARASAAPRRTRSRAGGDG